MFSGSDYSEIDCFKVWAECADVHYVWSTMHKCIMVKVGGSQKTKNNVNREEIYKFCWNRGICNMFHWLRGMDSSGWMNYGDPYANTSKGLSLGVQLLLVSCMAKIVSVISLPVSRGVRSPLKWSWGSINLSPDHNIPFEMIPLKLKVDTKHRLLMINTCKVDE